MKRNLLRRCSCLLLALLLLFSLSSMSMASTTDDFFNDSVFLGDSLTVGLESFVKSKRKNDSKFLGNAKFLAKVGYSLAETKMEDGSDVHPEYEGEFLQPQNALVKMNPSKVFITLGVNDAAGNQKTIVNNYKLLLHAIKSTLPKAKLYMIAIFPMTARKETDKHNNTKIDSVNARLRSLAYSENVTFIDFTDSLKEDGVLKAEYSRDDYVHLNNAGYSVWTKALYAFAKFSLAASSASSSDTATVINVKKYVNTRKEPSSSSKRVTTVPKGAKVTILEAVSNGWYRVSYNGTEMYIYGKYLSVGKSSGLKGVVSNVSNFVNLRKAPSTESERAGTAKKGTTFSVDQTYYHPNWYRVTANGKDVYVGSSYLKLK